MALSPGIAEAIQNAVAEGFDEQIEFTRQLIKFPSVRGAEHTIQDFIYRTLRTRGLAMERFDMDAAAIARHPGGSPISDEHSKAPIVVGIHGRPSSAAAV